MSDGTQGRGGGWGSTGRLPHPATVQGKARPPHPATVVQPKAPHPATVQGKARPPHPATVVQPKRAMPGPHAATVARPQGGRVAQRSKELEPKKLEWEKGDIEWASDFEDTEAESVYDLAPRMSLEEHGLDTSSSGPGEYQNEEFLEK